MVVEAGPRRRASVDFQLDPELAPGIAAIEGHIELAREGVILQQCLPHGAIHAPTVAQFAAHAEFGQYLDQDSQEGRPVETGIWSYQDEIQVLRKAAQAMEQAQAGAILEGGDGEEAGTPEAIQGNLLQDLLQCLLLLPGIGRGIARQALTQQIDDDAAPRGSESSSRCRASIKLLIRPCR